MFAKLRSAYSLHIVINMYEKHENKRDNELKTGTKLYANAMYAKP